MYNFKKRGDSVITGDGEILKTFHGFETYITIL